MSRAGSLGLPTACHFDMHVVNGDVAFRRLAVEIVAKAGGEGGEQ